MIDKLYDALLQGDLIGTVEDSKEKTWAGTRLENYITAPLGEKRMVIASQLLAENEYETGRQFFKLGFQAAMKLFKECERGDA